MKFGLPSPGRAAVEGGRAWLRANLAPVRMRFALVTLAFTIAGAGAMLMDARSRELQRDLADKQILIARIGQIGSTELWHQRRFETEASRLTAEARLWEAETDGLAQANFQSWIVEQANQAGIRLTDVRSSISNPTADNPLKFRKITTTFAAPFNADALAKLLQTIASQQRIVVVERLEIQTASVPRFEMVLGAYLQPSKT